MSTGDEPPAAGLAQGQMCYRQIAASDLTASARFSAAGFGWRTEPAGSGLEAPRPVRSACQRPGSCLRRRSAGLDPRQALDNTLAVEAGNGGEVVRPPSPDGAVRLLATIHDPAGNTVGIAGSVHDDPREVRAGICGGRWWEPVRS
jgi:hypothetical protein